MTKLSRCDSRRTSISGHVFVSYSRDDVGYVSRLADHLARSGISVWRELTILSGGELPSDPRSAIDQCCAHVPVLTPASVASDQVHREIRYAVEAGKPIQPLLLRFCSVPQVLAGFGYEDVTGDRLPSSAFTTQLRALASSIAPTSIRPRPDPTHGHTTSIQATVLRGHTDAVSGVAISADSKWLASSSFDGTVRLWEANGSFKRTIAGHHSGASDVAIAPDGTWLATSGDRTVSTWDNTGRARAKLTGHSAAVWAVDISADHAYIASAGIDHTVRLWPTTGAPPLILHGHADAVLSVAVGPNGDWLATGGADRSVRIWQRTGETVTTLNQPNAVSSVAIAPHGRWLVAASGGAALMWRADGTRHRLLDETHQVRSVAVAPTGDWLCAGCDDGAIRLWHIDRGPVGTLTGHRDVVEAAPIAPTGTWLASASKDRTVRLWRLTDP